MDKRYVAFISYRHTELDMAVAARLHQLIERYHAPDKANAQKRLGIAFRDKEELPVSGDLGGDIRNALDQSDFLIVVCTPDTPKSEWVRRDIEYFRLHHEQKNVLAVLAAGEPEEAFPYPLTHPDPDRPEWIVEPLAADVRADTRFGIMKNLQQESIRLFAAILGVPYDTLARREHKRKMRRQAIILSIALAVPVIAEIAAVAWLKCHPVPEQEPACVQVFSSDEMERKVGALTMEGQFLARRATITSAADA